MDIYFPIFNTISKILEDFVFMGVRVKVRRRRGEGREGEGGVKGGVRAGRLGFVGGL